MPLQDITQKVCDLADKSGSQPATKSYAVAAVLKLTAQLGSLLPCVAKLVQKYGQSRYVDLNQRCHEFEALVARPSLMVEVLPVDASCEDIEARSCRRR